MIPDPRSLMSAARKAQSNAHAPYSNRPQGAALQSVDGHVYTGASFELQCLAGSVSAVEGALGSAVSDGQRDFAMLAAVPRVLFGDALQLLKEFNPDLPIVTEEPDGTLSIRLLSELLPY
jgi:cytidine deaminase